MPRFRFPSHISLGKGFQPVHAFRNITDTELAQALQRWAPRLPDVDPERDLATIEGLGGGFLIPGDEHWPT
ncbi:hypothetical protein J2Y41_004569, partial [Arthrobacter sp. 1088]|nr:hypothetical protein [Arthrobacter sp. 1088]